MGKSPVVQRTLVMSCPCESLEGASHGTVNLVEPLGQENRPVGSRHIWTQMSQVSNRWCHKCRTVQCPMLREDNTNPKKARHLFSDRALAVEGKAVLSLSCKHYFPLAPHSCAAYWLSNVRGEKPLVSRCPKLLLCSQLFGLNLYIRALGEGASSNSLCSEHSGLAGQRN